MHDSQIPQDGTKLLTLNFTISAKQTASQRENTDI
jgi:hypothetical protein